jgi:hypothetical protein
MMYLYPYAAIAPSFTRRARRALLSHRRSGLVLAALYLGLGGIAALAVDDRAELEIIKQGYNANKAAFVKGKCRFRYALRSAATEADAIAEKWNQHGPQDSVESTLYWKGDMLALRMAINNDELVAKIKNKEPLITPMNVARKGPYAIDHDALVNNAIIHSPQHYDLNIRLYPFNLAEDSERCDPASTIEFAEAHKFEDCHFTIDKGLLREGRKWTRLVYRRSANSRDRHFYIDPERGYLPFITEMFRHGAKPQEPPWRMRLLDVHREGGAYYPLHAMLVMQRPAYNGSPAFVDVREMKVLELDLNYDPTPDDLTIELPKYTQYYDGVNPNTSKTLYASAKTAFVRLSVNDIEPLYHKLQSLATQRAQAQAARVARTVIKPERSTSRLWLIVTINCAVVVMLLGVLLVRRRREP